MPALVQAIRRRHEIARDRRAIDHALASAASPGMRDDIVAAAQRSTSSLR